ncbi:MAG: DUF4296 domain-containing protein [Bacteroidales bacterium]|nr:DUF4296 domain-containing protein [Bacteroidales bacterium]
MRPPTGLILCLIIFLASCTREVTPESDPPGSLIPRDTMVVLLARMHMAEAILYVKQKNGEQVKTIQDQYFRDILDEYGLTRDGFEDNLDWYQQDMEEFDRMYGEVITLISRLQTEEDER